MFEYKARRANSGARGPQTKQTIISRQSEGSTDQLKINAEAPTYSNEKLFYENIVHYSKFQIIPVFVI